MIRTQWLKPYARIEKNTRSIVGYAKIPHKYEYLPETEDEDGKNFPTTTQWEHYLAIDLWFLKLRANWVGREVLSNPTSSGNTTEPMPDEPTKEGEEDE